MTLPQPAPTWMWAVWAIFVLLLIFLIFRLYLVRATINDCAMVLVKQTFALRDYALGQTDSASLSWGADVLSVPGIKGDLLMRRFKMLSEWMKNFKGFQTDKLHEINARIKLVDEKLVAYHIHLSTITALTQKMIEQLYNGNRKEAFNILKNILQKIRLI